MMKYLKCPDGGKATNQYLRGWVSDRVYAAGADGRYIEGTEESETMRRKYDVAIDGYSIRNDADFDRADLSKSQRAGKHRKAKLEKRADTRR